jgi:hypothetical protein
LAYGAALAVMLTENCRLREPMRAASSQGLCAGFHAMSARACRRDTPGNAGAAAANVKQRFG